MLIHDIIPNKKKMKQIKKARNKSLKGFSVSNCHPERVERIEGSRVYARKINRWLHCGGALWSLFAKRLCAIFSEITRGSTALTGLWSQRNKRKLTAFVLTFLLILQTIIGVFTPINISITPPYISSQETRAAESTWEGDESTDWGTPGNWSLNAVPNSTTDVIIPDTANDPTISSSEVTILSLTINGATTLTLGNNLTVTNNADVNNLATITYTQGTAADLTVNGTLTVYSGGTITTPYTSLTANNNEGSGRTITAGNIDIQLGGVISADSKGFWANSGPGKSNTYADGGSYGGAGGDYGANGTIGSTYGSLNNPISLGSGGWHPSYGAGGAIIISSSGTVTVDGTLSANGTVVVSGGGLGSGGTINIITANLTGLGTISANGGKSSGNFGSGGGGRIAITQTTGTTWPIAPFAIQAFGGSGGTKGAAGTIYLKDANDVAGDGELIIDNNSVATASGTDTDISSLVTDTAVGDVTIRNGGKLQMDTDTTLTVSVTWNNTAGENLTAGTVIFDSTSSQNITSGSKSFYNLTFNGTGGTWTAQDALDVNNNLTITAGTLASNDQAISVANSWTNSVDNSGFTYGTSTVTLDGTDQTILGNTTFYNLTKNVTSADTLTFGNGTTQTITGTMDLQGVLGNLLSLRSDSTPTQWNIDPQGTRTISYLNVKDSNNINASQILVEGFNITDSDNNDGWLFNVASTTPTSLTQLKNDGTTAISNQGYTEENNVKLKASATDEDNPEIITLFFETALNSDSFNSPATPTTGTSCASGTDWGSCSNKIWYVTSSSGNYTSTFYTGTTNVAGLSDAASYKWQVKACDDNSECSSWAAYNATVPNFTVDTSGPIVSLSSLANDASTSNNQPTLTWSASDTASGIAKYQLYIDSVLDTDNISNSAISVAPANELSCGDHTWYVRAYDNVDNYTNSSTFNLTMSCGGGLPPSASNSPAQPEPTSENPEGGFSVAINDGDEYTNSEIVKLKLYAGADTKRMAISNTEDFEYASQVSYQEEIEWELSACGAGSFDSFLAQDDSSICTVYAKFYTQYGVASEVVSDSIILKTATAENQSENPDQEETKSETESDKDSESEENITAEDNKPALFIFTKTLQFGSNGMEVKTLQNKLKELNFFPKEIISNGNFGPATEKAIKEYQKSKGIYPCGIVGPRTRKALNDEEFITNKDYKFTQDLKYNDKNEEVKQLQIRLQDQNFFPYHIKSTGWFGPITQKAVNIFQKFYNLIQNGIVGEGMREVLNR